MAAAAARNQGQSCYCCCRNPLFALPPTRRLLGGLNLPFLKSGIALGPIFLIRLLVQGRAVTFVRSKIEMQHVHPFLIAQLLALVILANGTPVIAKKIFGTGRVRPLDAGIKLADGQPLFGHSKTLRGAVLAIIVTALGAPWIGLDWTIGLTVSAMAMTGDLLSSFTKRRMKLCPGDMALGLDQIPESLLPAAACRWALPVTALDMLAVAALFFISEIVASRALYKLNIRDRPY
jgi:hypothetical protein